MSIDLGKQREEKERKKINSNWNIEYLSETGRVD